MCEVCDKLIDSQPISSVDGALYNVLQDRHRWGEPINALDSTSLLIEFPNPKSAFMFASKLQPFHYTHHDCMVEVTITLAELHKTFDWLFHHESPVMIDGIPGNILRMREGI